MPNQTYRKHQTATIWRVFDSVFSADRDIAFAVSASSSAALTDGRRYALPLRGIRRVFILLKLWLSVAMPWYLNIPDSIPESLFTQGPPWVELGGEGSITPGPARAALVRDECAFVSYPQTSSSGGGVDAARSGEFALIVSAVVIAVGGLLQFLRCLCGRDCWRESR